MPQTENRRKASPRKTTRKRWPEATAADVQAAAEAARVAQAELEKAMLGYRASGASLAAIADAAGYSAPGVLGMLRRYGLA